MRNKPKTSQYKKGTWTEESIKTAASSDLCCVRYVMESNRRVLSRLWSEIREVANAWKEAKLRWLSWNKASWERLFLPKSWYDPSWESVEVFWWKRRGRDSNFCPPLSLSFCCVSKSKHGLFDRVFLPSWWLVACFELIRSTRQCRVSEKKLVPAKWNRYLVTFVHCRLRRRMVSSLNTTWLCT